MSDYELVQNHPIEQWVGLLVERHADLWAEMPCDYWLKRLMAEVGELAASLAGDHEHPWELEAAQVAAIASNMLRHKALAALT